MGVRDEAGDSAKEGERFYLEVRGRRHNIRLIESDVGVILFVDVEVFNETLP